MTLEAHEAACAAIGILTAGSDTTCEAIVRSSALGALIATVRAPDNSETIRQHACGALFNLAYGSETGRDAIVSADGVGPLVAAWHSLSGNRKDYALFVLDELGFNNDGTKK